eukprot:UN09637
MSISDAIATEYEIAAPVTEYRYNYKAAADQTGELSDGLRCGACAFGQTHSPHISYLPACPDDEDVVYHIANTNEYVKGEDIYSEVALLPLPIDTRHGSMASNECSGDDDLLRNVGDELKKCFNDRIVINIVV